MLRQPMGGTASRHEEVPRGAPGPPLELARDLEGDVAAEAVPEQRRRLLATGQVEPVGEVPDQVCPRIGERLVRPPGSPRERRGPHLDLGSQRRRPLPVGAGSPTRVGEADQARHRLLLHPRAGQRPDLADPHAAESRLGIAQRGRHRQDLRSRVMPARRSARRPSSRLPAQSPQLRLRSRRSDDR